MKQNYVVSILSYNHPDITSRCIRSVLQLVPHEKIFLTHNGSLDRHIETLKNEFPLIHHNIIKTNRGYSAGANEALKVAFKANHAVLFLTNDTELIKISEHPPDNFSSIKLLRRNSQEIDSVMGSLNPHTGTLKHLKNTKDFQKSHIKYIPGTAFWISKNIYEDVGGFDESFHTYWEDVDFSLRAQKINLPLDYDENTVCKHKIGKTCHKDRFYTYDLFQRNRGRFMTKHNLASLKFYPQYLYDIFKYSRSDFKKAFTIFKTHHYKSVQLKDIHEQR
ncbi:MAG: hypothetical protein ACK41T_03075 [Pseudobdellovibrio sp.]